MLTAAEDRRERRCSSVTAATMHRVLIHTSDEAAREVPERNTSEVLQIIRLAVSTPRRATERTCGVMGEQDGYSSTQVSFPPHHN